MAVGLDSSGFLPMVLLFCPFSFFYRPFVSKCLKFYTALLDAKVKTELHLYNQGGHGFDLGLEQGKSTSMWPQSFVAWLQDEGFIEP